jgi:hypothetical protein
MLFIFVFQQLKLKQLKCGALYLLPGLFSLWAETGRSNPIDPQLIMASFLLY